MSSTTTTIAPSSWLPHRLALPNELLHKIILWVLSDSVHTICISTEDTTWEQSVMDTLHQVSPSFKAISSEIAAKAFHLQRATRSDDARLLETVSGILRYLHRMGGQLRHLADWGDVSVRTIDCSASSLVFAYALYLSCVTLRRNAGLGSSRIVFGNTHTVILSALAQGNWLCEGVFPVEMTLRLKNGMRYERELAESSHMIVQAAVDLNENVRSMAILQPFTCKDGTGPLAGARSLVHSSLLRFETGCNRYMAAAECSPSNHNLSEPSIHQLPGVLTTLRSIHPFTFDDEEYGIRQRIERLVEMWRPECPFFHQPPKPSDFPSPTEPPSPLPSSPGDTNTPASQDTTTSPAAPASSELPETGELTGTSSSSLSTTS